MALSEARPESTDLMSATVTEVRTGPAADPLA